MVSINDQRVLFWDDSGSSFLDISKEVNGHLNGLTSTITLDVNDYIYIGSFLPFNNKYIELPTPNAVTTSIIIEVFTGTEWTPVSDYLDFTNSGGAPFGKSEILQFTPPNWDKAWAYVDRAVNNDNLPEFANGPDIYQKYWLRIGFSDPVTIEINYIGNLFCDEFDLLAEYPQFTSTTIKNSWSVGKSDWLNQRVIASEYVITDLKKRNIIIDRSQVVELETLKEPTIYRTASLIFTGLGARNYAQEITKAINDYKDSMNQTKFEQDVNGNGVKDRQEQTVTVRRATR